jgi:4'-phosphopantetheinyl transferase
LLFSGHNVAIWNGLPGGVYVNSSSESPGASGQKFAEKTPLSAGPPPVDRIDVWIISLLETEKSPDAIARAVGWLSVDERVRGERFAFDRDRRRFVLGRGAVRSILASYVDCDPTEIAFEYAEFGKPQLDAKHAAAGLQFNASGSADVAVCAVTSGQSVGIDIEQMRETCDPDLVRYAFSDAERAEFGQIRVEIQARAFYRVWTRKEAYLKAVGCGLSRPLTTFSVSVTPADAPRLVRDDFSPAATASWSFADFDPAPGWVGTLVHAGPLRPVRALVWSGLSSGG